MEIFSQLGWFAKLSLLAGLVPPVVAIAYAIRPAERTLAFARPVSLAAIFSAICGLAAGIAMGLQAVARAGGTIDRPAVWAGLGEALVPVFFNFGFLAMAWLLVAAGMLRRD